MSESETTTEHIEPHPQDQDQTVASKPDPNKIPTFSFSIWPPTQKTRDAVVSRLIETLSTESVLSKRYGTIPHDDASESARRIEEEAFTFAGGSAASAADVDDGIEILQLYSKEISKRMLETVKSRADSGSGNNKGETNASSEPAAEVASEEVEAEA